MNNGPTNTEIDDLKSLIMVARGKKQPDLVIRGCQLVNVYTREIYPADISLYKNKIAQIRQGISVVGKRELECKGLYALPGFIEPHMHLESSLLSPSEFTRAVVPLGTTTIFMDPHEVANVFGLRGVREFMKSARGLPLRVFLQVPSRVPSAPGLETTGGELTYEDLAEMVNWPETVSLGEIDSSKVLPLHDEFLKRILLYQQMGKLVNGSDNGLTGDALNGYIAAGIFDSHSQYTAEELLERLRFGSTPFMVETTGRRLLKDLLRVVSENDLDTRHLCHDIDDKDIGAILAEGFLDNNIKVALQEGIDPVRAVEMATINPATRFHMTHLIGSITPGRYADIVLVERIGKFPPEYVIFDGQIVAQNGKMILDINPYDYPEWFKQSITLSSDLGVSRLRFKVDDDRDSVSVRAIEVSDKEVNTKSVTVELPVSNGLVPPNIDRDILKICAFERYGKNGNVGVGFVSGFGLKQGAIGTSVSHDHHNLIIVGCSDEEILLAARQLQAMNGGWVVVQGDKELARMPLILGGLMSSEPYERAALQMEEVSRVAKEQLGCKLEEPFPTLSFIGLPTVPELGFSDKGLIDVVSMKLIDVLVG